MRISIAMATFNGAKYIQEQLESLSAQTLLPYELVVCDDGSTDDTLTIVREYAKSAPFAVRIFQNQENLQYTGNFLKAASLCGGEAVAFCDQDDLWDARKIEVCTTSFANSHADLLIHEGRVVDDSGRPTRIKIPDLSFDTALLNVTPFNRVAVGFSMVVRHEVIEEIMQFWNWADYLRLKHAHGVPLGHDQFIYAWCFEVKNIVFIKRELVKYRVHGDNFSIGSEIYRNRLSRLITSFTKLTIDKSRYVIPGNKWAAEVDFLNKYTDSNQSTERPGLKRLSAWYSRKSKLWLGRAVLYDRNISRGKRCLQLARLILSGTYFSQNEINLGARSMGKDLMVVIFC